MRAELSASKISFSCGLMSEKMKNKKKLKFNENA